MHFTGAHRVFGANYHLQQSPAFLNMPALQQLEAYAVGDIASEADLRLCLSRDGMAMAAAFLTNALRPSLP